MSKSFEMTGQIHSMGDTTTYGNNGFTKREFVLKATGPDENSSYPNYIALELIKDNCSMLDAYKVGDELQVMFNLSGRLWQPDGKPEKCFNSLQAWRITPVDQDQTPAQTEPQVSYTTDNSGFQSTSTPQKPSVDLPSDDWGDDIPF